MRDFEYRIVEKKNLFTDFRIFNENHLIHDFYPQWRIKYPWYLKMFTCNLFWHNFKYSNFGTQTSREFSKFEDAKSFIDSEKESNRKFQDDGFKYNIFESRERKIHKI